MKKFLSIFVCLMAMCMFTSNVFADTDNSTNADAKVKVYIFTKDGCPHCVEAKEYFAKLANDKTYGKMFDIVAIQVYDSSWVADETNLAIMNAAAKARGDEEPEGVPYIVIGKDYSVNGYAESLNEEIEKAIKKAYNSDDYKDIVAPIIANSGANTAEEEKDDTGAIIAIMAVAVVGVGAFVYFSRKK